MNKNSSMKDKRKEMKEYDGLPAQYRKYYIV